MYAMKPSECARSEALLTYKVADQPWELRSALRLVYERYLEAGLIRPNAYQMRVTPWHLLPTTEVLIASEGSEVICTASIVQDGDLGVPMGSLFPEEVASRRLMGVTFAEVSCLADRPAENGRSFSILRKLFQLIAQASRTRGIENLVIAVHPHHEAFYRRFLGFDSMGDCRSYRAVCDNPAVPMELDLVHLPVRHPKVYRTLFGSPFAASELRWRSIASEMRTGLESAARQYTNTIDSGAYTHTA